MTKFVNKCIAIIRSSEDEKRVSAFKNLVFKMMKDIVNKNIFNYINLLRNVNQKDKLPDKNELIADCYIIFDKCLEKYTIGESYNFYFYFNKSLSRNFYRNYQKELKINNQFDISEVSEISNKNLHKHEDFNSIEMLIEQMNFSELEKRICRSRLLGQKIFEFLEENKEITNSQYSKGLKHIKEILIIEKDKGEI